MSVKDVDFYRILSVWKVFGDTLRRDEDLGRSAPFYFYLIMKKIFTLILFSMIALNAIHAEITWDLADDGTLTISGTDMPDYNGFAPWGSKVEKIKKIVINNGVTNIGSYAFDGCTNLTSITIPNSVTSIGSVAFYGCTSLSSITIPNSVTSIGDMAFYGTKWYDKQPDGLIYAGLVLYKYKGTMPTNTNIVVKQGTNSIGYEAFYNCSGLTSITIPNSVTSIGSYAFYNCSGLTSITIPNSVTSIGGSAFSGCYILADKFVNNSICNCNYNVIDVEQKDGLLIKEKEVVRCRPWAVSVTIPNSVTSIGGAAFSGCSGLISIIVEKNNPKYDSRNDCNAIIETQSNTLIVGCKNTVIPNSVTSIGGQAFSGCSDLTSITIPNSVTSIGERAFYYCSGLTAITIPNSVTSIGSLAFDNTKWYDNQPDGLVYAGLVLYKYKGTMPENTKINLKEGIKGIADSAFKGCLGLTSITIPNSVTRIGNSAFYNCSGITSIEIPNSVTSIGEGVLGGCSGLTSIIVEKANSKFDNRNNCNAIIETQSNSLIAGCMNTVIPNSIRSIGGGAFSGCTGLTSVDIPSSVTSVGASAFRNCTGLTSITIPNSVTSIGIYAFAYCI